MYTCTLTKSPHNTTACLYVGDGTMAEVDHSTSRDVPSTCTGASKANPSQYIAFCALVETLYMAQFHPFIRSSIHVCHGLDPKQTPSLSIQYSLSLWGSPAQNCNHSPKDNMLLLDWRRNERIPLNTCHGALPDPYWFSLEPAPAQLSLDIRRRRLKKKKKTDRASRQTQAGIGHSAPAHNGTAPFLQRKVIVCSGIHVTHVYEPCSINSTPPALIAQCCRLTWHTGTAAQPQSCIRRARHAVRRPERDRARTGG